LFLKGRETEAEIEAARLRWEFDSRLHPSLTAKDANLVEVTNLRERTEESST
ncbi:unnamed protein product, partial [marine sediment metagenome]